MIKKIIKKTPLVGSLYNYLIKHIRVMQVKRDRRLLQRYGFEAILAAMRALEETGLVYFAECGTLLGLIRDGGFMKYDDDVDMGVVMTETVSPSKIMQSLMRFGFKYLSCYEYENRIEQIAVSYKGLRVDIFFNRIIKEGWMCYRDFGGELQNLPDGRKSLTCYESMRPAVSANKLIHIEKFDIAIPANFEDLLIAEYGNNWRVPDPHWNPATDKKYPRRTLPGSGYCLVPIERVYELG